MQIKPIRTESEYNAALARVDALWDAKPRTKKGDELAVWVLLIEDYESKHYRILPPDPIEAIKFRMDQLGLKKADLAKFLGGRNRATEILNGKRTLSVRMLQALHNELHIPAASLLAENPITTKKRAA